MSRSILIYNLMTYFIYGLTEISIEYKQQKQNKTKPISIGPSQFGLHGVDKPKLLLTWKVTTLFVDYNVLPKFRALSI